MGFSRRCFILSASAGALASCTRVLPGESEELVNDTQSLLNPTLVRRIEYPRSTEDVQRIIWSTRKQDQFLAICGGRHSMGGQQFASHAPLLDIRSMDRILSLDPIRGVVRVQAGIQWPALIQGLRKLQGDTPNSWCIREKQTGVDYVTLAGSISSNVHGRGLSSPPFVSDIESLQIVDARGTVREISRTREGELFSLVCGGYGLFGVITEVSLRLVRLRKVQRVVEIIPVRELLPRMQARLAAGFSFGDCQFAIDLSGEARGHPGVFSCYKVVDQSTELTPAGQALTPEQWAQLYELTRSNKREAFRRYADYYLHSSGRVYWWDQHQLAGDFFRGYEKARDPTRGTEMITEVYVRADSFLEFMGAVRTLLAAQKADLSFGTIRFIKRDAESFLAWAKDDLVCVVCNLHVMHTELGKHLAATQFRSIIDTVLRFGGRYYLTYHRHATPPQLLKAYPEFPEFLRLKQHYDSEELFQSDWYRHYRQQLPR